MSRTGTCFENLTLFSFSQLEHTIILVTVRSAVHLFSLEFLLEITLRPVLFIFRAGVAKVPKIQWLALCQNETSHTQPLHACQLSK